MSAIKLAISSSGPLSGKTTLAKYLQTEYNFIRADHSQTLVEVFVFDWNLKLMTEDPQRITVANVYANKDEFRPMLQKFGDDQGYNSGVGMERFIKRTLQEWLRHKPELDVVYDSIRSEGQAKVLKDMGFTLVQLEISEDLRRQRAAERGMDYDKIKAAMDARPDLERGIARPDVTLVDQTDLEVMSKVLMMKPWQDGYIGIFGNKVPYHG